MTSPCLVPPWKNKVIGYNMCVDDLGMHGLKQCQVVLIRTFGFQTNYLFNFHNENQIVSHLVIIRLRIELTILTQMNTKLLKINYYVFNFF